MSVSFVHHFHSETSSVQDVCPGVHHTTFTLNNGLIEVKPVEVESHGADAEGGKPDSHDRPGGEEEVEGTRVVETGVLEDESSEVAMSSNDVVGLFLLTKFVSIVLGDRLGSLPNKGGSDETSVHSREQRTAEYTSNAKHVERVHEDVVFCLEDKHVVERAADTERHSITKRTLTERINKEDRRGSCHRGRVSNEDPGSHTEAVREFPLTSHVAEDSKEEVEDNQLIRTTIVEPLIECSGFPNRVKVKANGVRGRNNGTRDDVVAIQEGTGNGFTDSVNINRRGTNEGDDEADSSCEKCGDHQDAEPANIEAVVCRCNPLAE